MKVVSVRFTNQQRDEVEVSSDLGDFYLDWPCRSWHRVAILAWLDEGNKIRPFRQEGSPDVLREGLVREAYRQAARLLDDAVSDYSVTEQIIWPDLEREARRFLLDGTRGPLMQAELGDGEGRSEEELAYAVIHRANRLNRFRGAVVAARSQHVRTIRKAAASDLDNYNLASGWPSLPADCATAG